MIRGEFYLLFACVFGWSFLFVEGVFCIFCFLVDGWGRKPRGVLKSSTVPVYVCAKCRPSPGLCIHPSIHSIEYYLQPNTPCAILFTSKNHTPSLATSLFSSSFSL